MMMMINFSTNKSKNFSHSFCMIILCLLFLSTTTTNFFVESALISNGNYPPSDLPNIASQSSFAKYDWAKVIVNIYFRFQTPAPTSSSNTTTEPAPTPPPYFPQCEYINATGSTFNDTIPGLNITLANGTNFEVNGTSYPGCFETPYETNSSVFFPKVDNFAGLKIARTYDNFVSWTDVLIEIEFMGVKSSQRGYRDSSRSGFYVGKKKCSLK